ncbi:MAG TPA: YkgJ family cysteine cluster protein [Thermoplasmatales archaeon]|nr:YkgJ family cysteine cluster protein [Thermoplasmatales archaeon]
MRALVDKVLEICEKINSMIGACSRCSRCCYYRIPILQEDKQKIANYLGISLDEIQKTLSNGYIEPPCPFLEKNECKIYPARPIVCRMYPFLLLNEGLFLVNINECQLAKEIYKKLGGEEKTNVVKVSLTQLEKLLANELKSQK